MRIRKLFLLCMMVGFSAAGFGQALTYTPPPQGLYVSTDGTTWNPNTSAGGFGALTFVPPPFGAYCQASLGAAWTPCTFTGGGGGSGTVTSVAWGTNTALGGLFFTCTVASPTTAAVINCTLANAAQNTVLAGPASGGAAAPSYQTAPTFSAANLTNFPTFNQNTTGTAANVTGIVTPLHGGTGLDTSGSTGYPLDTAGTWTINSATTTFSALYNTVATTLGDMVYAGASAAPTRLAGNTATNTKVLTSTGSGGLATAPVWTLQPAIDCTFCTNIPVAFSAITTGTNTTATMTVGTGASIVRSGTGSIDASLLGGLGLSGTGAGVATMPISGCTANGILTAQGTTGGVLCTTTLFSSLAMIANANNFSGSNLFQKMYQATVATVASASTVAPVTPIVIFSGTTTIDTITPPSGTAALIGAEFDFYSTSGLTISAVGNVATSVTVTAGIDYHCTYYGTTDSKWRCK